MIGRTLCIRIGGTDGSPTMRPVIVTSTTESGGNVEIDGVIICAGDGDKADLDSMTGVTSVDYNADSPVTTARVVGAKCGGGVLSVGQWCEP